MCKGVYTVFSVRKTMNSRKLRIAAWVLVWSMAIAVCAGCRAKGTQELDILSPKDSADGGKEAMQDQSDESPASGGTEDNKAIEASQIEGGEEDSGREKKKRIFVYVCGAVQAPGVYELEEGARLYEAIASAGGVREDAAEESINQAQAVADGERLYIPTDEDVRQSLDEFFMSGVSVGDKEAKNQRSGSVSGGSGADASGKVNVNTASREELKTLNGIGDTRAESILSYRELNGPFQCIEDLMKVDGIKEGVFNKMKDSITVN